MEKNLEKAGRHLNISLGQNPFFAPPEGALGDTFPFFHNGTCHLFLLQPPHIAHFVSSDWVNWQARPIAIPLGAPGEPDSSGMIATGTVVERDGTFYMFYTAGGVQTICLATSTDLDNWIKHPSNPVLTGDSVRYVKNYFRDPYIFFNQQEGCWWMLFGSRVVGRPDARAGCVGLAKSTDLLHWTLHDPLFAPGIGPHHDCPQLIEMNGSWVLFYLQRNTRYRVGRSPDGPFERQAVRDIGAMYAAAGSRPVFDGKRWISFPFVISLHDGNDQGNWKYGGSLTVPRELEFTDDQGMTERALTEVVAALDRLPAARIHSHEIIGNWDTSEPDRFVCTSAGGGALLIPNVPSAVYIEAEAILPKREMEAHLILRAADDLSAGYKLALHPGENCVDVRHISSDDIDRVLVSCPVELPLGQPIKLQIFLSGSVLDAFIDYRASITTRVYQRREGALILEFRDAASAFLNIRIHPLQENEHQY